MQIGPKLAYSVAGVFRTPERYLKALKQGKPAVCSCRIKSGSRRRLFSFVRQSKIENNSRRNISMAYRQVYFRIHTKGYSSGWSSDADRSAFKAESCRLFQELGWTIEPGHNGSCDVVTKDRQDLYLHPTSFSGVINESNIQSLQKQILKRGPQLWQKQRTCVLRSALTCTEKFPKPVSRRAKLPQSTLEQFSEIAIKQEKW